MKIVLVPTFIFHNIKSSKSKSSPHLLEYIAVFVNHLEKFCLFSSFLFKNPGASLKSCESGGLLSSFPTGVEISTWSVQSVRKG